MVPKLETLSVEVRRGVAIIKYNRPAQGNALGSGIMRDMCEAYKWAEEDSDIRVIVQSGEGRFFCAGMDLVDIPVDEKEPVLSDVQVECLREIHARLINSKKVLIAAVNGPAVGWGTSSLGLFDLVYSVPDAFYFLPFIKWGLAAEACSSVSFAKIMGRQKMSSLILAQERMTAQELESAGLISKIIPKEKFMEDVLEIADRIAKLPPDALKFNKELLMKTIKADLLDANERECEGLRQRGRTKEPREAIKAFAVEQKSRRGGKTQSKL